MGKSSRKTSQQDAATAPKCLCPDPYKCVCGNRPPRPSKGHKWYPDSQTWAGKGHRQTGASGQVASVAAAPKTTAGGSATLEAWQRLPSALLAEYVKKQKRPPARYSRVDARRNQKEHQETSFRYRVVLPDPKQSDKDLLWVSPRGVPNEEQAKEEVALLALLALTPNLPHERRLPEPYRQTWLQAQEAASRKNVPRSSDASADTSTEPSSNRVLLPIPGASVAERRAQELRRRQERNARIRHHEAVRMANLPHRVFMSARIRRNIEALLRGEAVRNFQGLGDVDEDNNREPWEDDGEDPALDLATRDRRAYVVQRLVREGFTQRQAYTAFKESDRSMVAGLCSGNEDEWDESYEASLQWLLVHLEEDLLPEGFDPKGGMLDVIAAPKPTLAPEVSEFAKKYNLTEEEAALVITKAKETNQPSDIVLWDTIVLTTGVSLDNGSVTVDAAANLDLLNAEIEAIMSIYDSACVVLKDESETLISIDIPETELKFQIVVQDGLYPSMWPRRMFVSGKWQSTSPMGTALHCDIIRFMIGNLVLGDFMILELLGHIQEKLMGFEDLPAASLVPKGDSDQLPMPRPVSNGASMAVNCLSKTKGTGRDTRLRRPRERAQFWSVPPRKTPPAVAFPKISKLLEHTRKSLPAASSREEFLSKLEACGGSGNVMLVTGSTGCGKTTQICQFILENSPLESKIVVAQPRRLAATGVAARVAEERGEERPGLDSVGYVVRGDSALCERTRLVFCTTGVLLRQLQHENALDCLSHIVIDEVHERNLDSDILMGLLKQMKESYPRLKIILMSATIDSERLAAYWGPRTPTMDIPGRTFPVVDYTLEDVFALTHTQEASSIEKLCKDAKILDYDLIARLVKYLILNRDSSDDGSILVFLPGAPEINRAIQAIQRRTEGIPLLLLPLHGSLQPKDQSKVFAPPPRGIVKIILSTNVAETSVTIPDCTVVIDTCREKQSSYDPSNRMPLLVEQYASKASLQQRRGRAGRVRAGVCYKLLSRSRLSELADHTEPEIRRCSLDQIVLALLYLGVEEGSGKFMSTLLDPPAEQSFRAAAASLKLLGAVEDDSDRGLWSLTPLGKLIAGIPAPPIIGKLLIMGSVLGCRSAAIGMAAALSMGRSPFLNLDEPRHASNQQDEEETEEVIKNRRRARARRELADRMGNSDHGLLASIYSEWSGATGSQRKNICESLGLSFPAMNEMGQLGRLLDSALSSIGFRASTEADRNANSPRIIHACAVAAMSPGQLVKIVRPKATYDETAQGSKEKNNQSKDLKLFVRALENGPDRSSNKEERVFIHPSSSNFTTGNYSFPWLVYFQLMRTSKPFLRDVTECSPYALLLFGGPLSVQASKELIYVDNWAVLSANARIGSLVGGLRRQVDQLMALKTADVSVDISSTDTMRLITTIIKTDGLGGSK